MLPMAWLLQPGPFLGHGAFWASGLPGGLDYAMLVAVKKKWLSSLTEKRINTQIHVWMRCPGCLYHALFCWIAMVEIGKRRVAHAATTGDEAFSTFMPLPNSPLPQNTPFWYTTCLWVVLVTF